MAFTTLTINDGLSQGLVMRIFQDRYGFMWFATLDGLNRYDGYRFVVFRHDARDETSITESYVQTLFEDSKGRLWIGTISGGLDLFDRETETFIHIKRGKGGTSLSPGPITSIAEDRHGNIWVQVADALYKITMIENEKASRQTFSIYHAAAPFRSALALLFATKKGRLYYVAAEDGVLYGFNEATGTWSVALQLDDYGPKPGEKRAQTYRIVQVVEDTIQGKFYVFHDGGVIRCDARSGKVERLFRNAFIKNQITPSQVCMDASGIAWFTDHDKLFGFNTHSGQLTYITASNAAFSWPVGHSYTAYVDRSGLLWVGTSGYGILKRNKRAETFHHNGNSSLYVIREAANGNILFGSYLGQAKIFDRAKAELRDAKAVLKTVADAAYYTRFFDTPLVTDATGAWFVDSNRLRHVTAKEKIDYRLPLVYNDDYPDFIQCGINDSNSNIWLGTTEGLLRFNIVNKSWTVYPNRPDDPTSPSSKRIFSLCLDPLLPKKYLWIGTDGGGLNRMDLATGGCIVFTVKDGLPNNVVYGILPDDDGNLWLSTNKGLSCFNLAKKTFRNFDYKDGLQSNEFNRRSYYRAKDGCLFFGGVNGFNYFYPREILNNKTVPQILITGLRIRNQAVQVQSQGSPLTAATYLTKRLTLPYKENFVSFDFAALDFTSPEKNEYQYKLEGLDNDWVYSGNTNNATYTNLDPGTYTFKVKGSNNDGLWNESGTSIKLSILPPWYMTWWTRSALAVVLLVSAYGFYRYRLAQALKLQAIRDRIAGDLHDEVGSNLSNIFIFSKVVQQKVNGSTEAAPLLQKISDYTQQSMEAMNDIVWMINTRNDRFENIMVRMRILAAEFSETSDCKLDLDFDEKLNDVKLSMEKRKNLYLIYKEAINNTAKYAGCKSLRVELKLEQNMITLKIRDNGDGFDPANAATGNGLFNMKKRAELLNGSLTVASKVGEGTTIRLRFKA